MKKAGKKPRYCKRHRKMRLLVGHDEEGRCILGEEVSALITRYRFGAKRRKPHYVYWHDGTFYKATNCPLDFDPDGKPCAWEWALQPVPHATAWDAYLLQTVSDGNAAPVSLTIVNGKATATGAAGTIYEGAPFLNGGEPADYVAMLLDLDMPAYQGKHFKAA